MLYPLLAEKVTFDPDHPKFVIFHLNPKARFSNGQLLTAEDVKFSFDTFQNKGKPGLQSYISNLEKTEVLSKYQVKLTFKADNNIEMPLIVATLPILSKEDWKQRDFTRITMKPVLGSGPYLIDRIDAGRSITYKRNPNYWGKDLPVNRGRYNFDRLKYVYYRNPASAFEGFKSGQYSLRQELVARSWVTEYQFPAMRLGIAKKYVLQRHYPIPAQQFVLNTRKPPLNDIRVRQALNYAYDFEWKSKAILYGQYQRLQSYFAHSDLEATGKPNTAEMKILTPLLPQLSTMVRSKVLSEWKEPISDGSGFNRNNLLIARKLLLQAGFMIKGGQLQDTHGKPVQFEFLTKQDGATINTIMPFVRNLNKLGIVVNIRQVDAPSYTERMRRFDFDLTNITIPQSLTPGNEQVFYWGSNTADQEGNYNYAGIKNPVIDRVIQQVIQSKNREELVTTTRVLDRLLRAGYYHILTYGTNENWFAYWDLYERPKVQPKLKIGLDYWWVNPQKAKKIATYLNQ